MPAGPDGWSTAESTLVFWDMEELNKTRANKDKWDMFHTIDHELSAGPHPVVWKTPPNEAATRFMRRPSAAGGGAPLWVRKFETWSHDWSSAMLEAYMGWISGRYDDQGH